MMIVLYDGTCGLCQWSIQFILKHERQPALLFCSFTSAYGQQLQQTHQFSTDSVVLIEKESVHTKSTAALKVAKYLRFPYSYLSTFLFVPPFIRNTIYDYIARNRHRWFQNSTCFIPTPEQRKRFLQ